MGRKKKTITKRKGNININVEVNSRNKKKVISNPRPAFINNTQFIPFPMLQHQPVSFHEVNTLSHYNSILRDLKNEVQMLRSEGIKNINNASIQTMYLPEALSSKASSIIGETESHSSLDMVTPVRPIPLRDFTTTVNPLYKNIPETKQTKPQLTFSEPEEYSYTPDEIENIKRDYTNLGSYTQLSKRDAKQRRQNDLKLIGHRLVKTIPSYEDHNISLTKMLLERPGKGYYERLNNKLQSVLIKRAPIYENGKRIDSDKDFRLEAFSPSPY